MADPTYITLSGVPDLSAWSDYQSGDPNGNRNISPDGSGGFVTDTGPGTFRLRRSVGNGWYIDAVSDSGTYTTAYKTPDGASPPSGSYGTFPTIGGTATVPVTTAPEMNVKGNGVSIADGDTTPTTADHTDFGSVAVVGGTQSRTFTIENTGDGDLTLSGSPKVAISGTHASDFTVTTQPSSPVAASGSTTFTVQFDPSASGVRTATVSITNDDSDENPYNFDIQGTGVDVPDINVQGNGVSIPDGTTSTGSGDHTLFPSTEAFSTSTRTFTIQNTGSSTLTISGVTSSSNDFDILTPPAGTVSAGGSTTFIVRAKPLSPGTKGSTITISSDDPDAEASYTFNVAVVASWPDTLSFSSGCIFDLTV